MRLPTEQAVPRFNHSQRGFTFLEIIIALMILATAAGLLIGLESATVRRTIQDRNNQQAMLAARRIMSVLETTIEPEQLQSIPEQPLLALLGTLGASPNPSEDERRALDRFSAAVTIEVFPLPIPNVEPEPLQMIVLKISWGDKPTDSFILQSLVPMDSGAANT